MLVSQPWKIGSVITPPITHPSKDPTRLVQGLRLQSTFDVASRTLVFKRICLISVKPYFPLRMACFLSFAFCMAESTGLRHRPLINMGVNWGGMNLSGADIFSPMQILVFRAIWHTIKCSNYSGHSVECFILALFVYECLISSFTCHYHEVHNGEALCQSSMRMKANQRGEGLAEYKMCCARITISRVMCIWRSFQGNEPLICLLNKISRFVLNGLF